MAKKKKGKPQREITRRQLSRWQQQRRKQRIILSLGIFIIVVVLSVIGVGWYIKQYQPLQQTVISVNDTKFNMGYYIKTLKFYGEGQPITFMYTLAGEVETIIERNELVRQGTMKLGISVSDEEVDEELKSHDPPFNDVHRDIVRSQMLVGKLQDEYFEQKVPVYTEQRHVMAMLLESEHQANEVRLRLEDGESFADLAEELSLEVLSKTEKGDLGWHPREVLTMLLGTSIVEDYSFVFEVGVLSQPIYDEEIFKDVGYWLIEVLEREAEAVHVQAILLANEEEAQSIRARLEAGEDFATLVEELSQLEWSKENGGDLGWLTQDMTSPAFNEFIFNAEVEVGIVSEPIRDDTTATKGGYWLVKVLDKDDSRQIEDSDRDLLKDEALNKWLEALWDDPENKVESYLDDEKRAWAVDKAMKELELNRGLR